MASTNASVTEQVAEWVVNVGYDDLPQPAIDRVPNLVLYSVGNQFAGLTVRLGKLLSEWVRAQGATPEKARPAAVRCGGCACQTAASRRLAARMMAPVMSAPRKRAR